MPSPSMQPMYGSGGPVQLRSAWFVAQAPRRPGPARGDPASEENGAAYTQRIGALFGSH
ncbi:hypothetical protein [Collimonas sp. OK307]|uniref:hypothetical protein n=1 Tax=Collimonas sp. OK307 TaxID=1801620 RepID=UPI001587895E|nr:hypothetical protein [Collimonas sp. OK307]